MTASPEQPAAQPGVDKPTTAALCLADDLVEFVTGQVERFSRSNADGLTLPSIYAGHPVLGDTVADLLYVMGLLVDAGVSTVDNADLGQAIIASLRELNPDEVEAFYSYRVAETVLRLGGLEAIPADLHPHVLAAADSPKTVARLLGDNDLPPNYAIVAARVLTARAALEPSGRPVTHLDTFVQRTRDMLGSQPNGWINDGMGTWDHYDIYTPDMYLFAEPLAEELGDLWIDGFRNVLADLDQIAQPGGAVVWGRSVGILGLAMTVELAANAVARNLADTGAQRRWLQRARLALVELDGWFANGVVRAHQDRAPMFYRGTSRRLQLTFDIYGKLLLAAKELRDETPKDHGDAQDRREATWPNTNTFIRFAPQNTAGVWSYRSVGLAFVLPAVTGFSAEYLPSPRSPGLFEQPTGAHPTMLPVIAPKGRSAGSERQGRAITPAGLPSRAGIKAGAFTMEHQGWARVGAGPTEVDVEGSRLATYQVDGRTLRVHERLRFETEELPGPLSITVAETPGRPLDVQADHPDCRINTIDTSGLSEWRSFWGPLPRVHQIEVPVANDIDFTWSVTPRVVVASTIQGHAYDKALYGPLRNDVVAVSAGWPDDTLAHRLGQVDVLHLAWPEWWTGTDPDRTAAVLDVVAQTGTRILWTQHNLVPHADKGDNAAACYQLWAQAADLVIHHTAYGRDVALATYAYGPRTRHVVIPHGHWGRRYRRMRQTSRTEVEQSERWAPAGLRLGVVGAPRAEKQLQLVVDAVAASSREDLHLVIRSDNDVDVPNDKRITAEYGHVEEARFHQRLAAFDALVLPFAPHGMLTTGTAFDAIGAGVAAVTSEWAFFDEVFDGADIRYGQTVDDLAHCIDGLTPDALAASAAGMRALQPRYDWEAAVRPAFLDALSLVF